MKPIQFALLMGLLTSLLANACAVYIWHNNIANLGDTLIIPSSLAGFCVGILVWWMLVAKRLAISVKRGFWTGFLAGILIHPVSWYFNVIRANVCYYLLHTCSHCPPPTTLFQGIFSSITVAYFSLYKFGLITIFVSSLIGCGLAYWQKRAMNI